MLKQAALSYAAIGWYVFPLKPGEKAPATAHGFLEATRDTSVIEKWWGTNPSYNIGIATGASDLVIIDLDEDNAKGKHGIQTLAEWENSHGALPDTVCCHTPRGGKHLYFKTQEHIKCKTNIYPAIDIRSEGGYVVAPPSVVNDIAYRWLKAPGIYSVAKADNIVYTFLSPVPNSFNQSSIPFSMPDEIPEGQRTSTLLRMLGSMQSKGMSDEAIRAAVMAENSSRCNPPMTDEELESTIFPALKRFSKGTAPYTLDRDYTADSAEIVEHLKELHPENNKRYGWHDAGNGNLFADLFMDKARFVPERKKWYVYDDTCWTVDIGNTKVMNLCKCAAGALLMYTAVNVTDETVKSGYLKHISKWQQQKYRETILKDAATVAHINLADFDCDPYLFNCSNGTLNLKDMTFREHDSGDFITKVAPVNYVSGARCERWERFITEITCGDQDLARYIQKALGYALSGDTKHECFFILYGATSRNGKGTLCETFLHLVGDYGKTANPESIATRKNTDSRSPSEDIARLAGARFVNMSEPDKKMMLSAALVKTLTGNDTVTARFLGEGSFDFKPQMKMFVNTNHLPYVNDSTVFSSNRVKVIPFNKHFTEAERDMQLKAALTTPESLSGILNWCIEGWQLLNIEGFSMPAAVSKVTQGYEEDSDKMGQFISDCLIPSPSGESDARLVHGKYQEWCYANGLKPEGFSEFKKSLASAGIETKRKRPNGTGRSANPTWHIVGYTLLKTQ